MTADSPLMRLSQVGARFGHGPRWARDWANSTTWPDEIPLFEIGGVRYVRTADLERWIAGQAVAS